MVIYAYSIYDTTTGQMNFLHRRCRDTGPHTRRSACDWQHVKEKQQRQQRKTENLQSATNKKKESVKSKKKTKSKIKS